ncbi:TM2 domain-containing protein 1 isoform X2 [Heptranchias perlo]|uniref:TM2 domain-containing protein 1 isoform X2 n=1 Tax=Heptranchias perlo TaxID=212740 RepID=UPI00355ACA7C
MRRTATRAICETPKINDVTQEPENCTNYTAFVPCIPAPNITCRNYNGIVNTFNGKEVGFYKPFSCRNVTGYSYKVAVALSLFLGWLGADRFYLGYPALALTGWLLTGAAIRLAAGHETWKQLQSTSIILQSHWKSISGEQTLVPLSPPPPHNQNLEIHLLSKLATGFYMDYFYTLSLLGLLKFCTVGFCGIGSLIDFVLISVQIVGPADGSSYIIDYYGARLTRLVIDNDTYRKKQMEQ